MKNMNRFIF